MQKEIDAYWNILRTRTEYHRGYLLIALRMLLKVVTDPHMFRQITGMDVKQEARMRRRHPSPPKKATSELEEELRQAKIRAASVTDTAERGKIVDRIRTLRKRLRNRRKSEKIVKTDEWRARQREYQRRYRARRKEREGK